MRVTKQTGVCIMVTLLLLDICNTTAETAKHTGSLDDTKHRSRRQTGDIVLIGLKAKSALKGTTKPSDFFRRIGKKRSYGAAQGSSALNLLRQELQPYEEYTEDLYTV